MFHVFNTSFTLLHIFYIVINWSVNSSVISMWTVILQCNSVKQAKRKVCTQSNPGDNQWTSRKL